MQTLTYTTSEIFDIQQDGFTYELPDYSLMLINKISKQVGAPSYIKTPIFKKQRPPGDVNSLTLQQETSNAPVRNKKRKNKHGGRELTDDEWLSIRNFESTKMEEAKDECQKELNNVRALLNKISDCNYDTIKEEILFKIYELQENNLIVDGDKNNMWNNICNLIIDTSCTNAFYSEQYVKLVSEIYDKNKSIKDVFNKEIFDKMSMIYDIKYVDPDEDYDEFCKNNILSQRRKSFATFISNLYKFDLMSEYEYIDILFKLTMSFKDNIMKEDKSFVCDEISELIESLIGTNHKQIIEEIDDYDEYLENFEEISKMNRKQYKSLTNKAIFKFCDIVDAFAKQ
tara:strand:+ start:89 stop:1114 length:1026 start_codon:yes stop_codon:yes gene_type:complete